MKSHSETYPILLNDGPARGRDLAPLAFAGFAHFTALQVRARRIKGLDLHLARLRNASIDLFGRAPSNDSVTRNIRRAIEDGPQDQSLTVTVFSPEGEFSVGEQRHRAEHPGSYWAAVRWSQGAASVECGRA